MMILAFCFSFSAERSACDKHLGSQSIYQGGHELGVEGAVHDKPAADIDLGTLERQFCYSRFHIEKRFRARYGTSVMKYRGSRRMDFARELLADHSVSEAGALAGFSSVYVFSRAFKQYFGCSPSSLRKG